MFDTVASVWVSTWEYFFAKPEMLKQVTEGINKCRVTRDLEDTDEKLTRMEKQLVAQIKTVTSEAVARKRNGDVSGAKRKIMDRRRLDQQLDRLRGSQAVIVMHMDSMQNNELNLEIVRTLRKSSEAMRQLAPGMSVVEIEDNMFDLEEEMKRAKEIGDVLSRPMTSDSMQAVDSDAEDELDELIALTDDRVMQPPVVQSAKLAISTTQADRNLTEPDDQRTRIDRGIEDVKSQHRSLRTEWTV